MKHKIIILVGMSSSGKSSICSGLTKLGYKSIVTNTTRPPREHEKDGVDYNFITESKFKDMIDNGQMLEYQKYSTVFGTWYYGSSDNNINLKKHDYVIVLTLKGAEAFVRRFGKENCIIFYIDCPSVYRESRAKKRGSFNQSEWNRRLITDKEDFPIEKIYKICDFKIANYNKKLYNVIQEIENDIQLWKGGYE